MKATRCYQDPQQSSAHVWEGSSSHCKATESASPQLCCRPHGIPLRLEAAQGEARHRGAGRTALVVLAPLLSAASPPKNGEHSWARSWDRRSRQGNTSPSQPRPSIPKNVKRSGRGCPCSPSPVVLGILQKDAPALPARTWLKDQLSRHLSQERNPRGWGCAPNLGQPAGRCVKAALHPHHIREEQGLGEVLHSH